MADLQNTILKNAQSGLGRCAECPAYSDGRSKRVNPGLGNDNPEIMFVTIEPSTSHTELIDWDEYPDWERYNEEFRQKILEKWDSGEEIARILEPLDPEVAPEDIWIADSVKCSPNGASNQVRAEEFDQCRYYLQEEIDTLDPKIIITLGKLPTERTLDILDQPMSIDSIRANAGRIIDSTPPLLISTSWSYGNLNYPLRSIDGWGSGWVKNHEHLDVDGQQRIIDAVRSSLVQVYSSTSTGEEFRNGQESQSGVETDSETSSNQETSDDSSKSLEDSVKSIEWSELRLELEMDINSATVEVDEGGEVAGIELEIDQVNRANFHRGLWQSIEENTGIKFYDGSVLPTRDKTISENVRGFVAHLLDHGHLSRNDLPIPAGRKRYFVHTEPVNQIGDPMVDPIEVRDGIYAETDYSFVGLSRRLDEVVSYVGLDPDDGS